MLNHVTVYGRLTADPVLRYTNSQKAVCSFTIANDSDYKNAKGEKKVSFLDCVVWDKGAEFVSGYFKKGSAIIIEGRVESRNWKDTNGNNRVSTEIIADKCYFAESRRSETTPHANSVAAPEMEELDDDGVLPF